MPPEKPVVEDLAKKEERIKSILEKETKVLTYAEWILAERLKHQRTGNNSAEPAHSSDAPTSLKGPSADESVSRAVSAAELSENLAASPKEDEVWATDCAVCLAEFGQEEEVRELPCEHIFHHDCIFDWFMKAKSAACPLCRNLLHSGLSTDQIVPPPTVPPPNPAPVEAV